MSDALGESFYQLVIKNKIFFYEHNFLKYYIYQECFYEHVPIFVLITFECVHYHF